MSDYIDGSDLHLLPGDAYPGLLAGWCGPGVFRYDGDPQNRLHVGVWLDGINIRSMGRMVWSGVDLRRSECAHRVRDVLEAGVRCDCDVHRCTECGAVGTDTAFEFCAEETIVPFPEWDHAANECGDCNGTGYLIQPADLGWTRTLPAWQAAAILAASVRRVVAGEGPVVGMLGEHDDDEQGRFLSHPHSDDPGTWTHVGLAGWEFVVDWHEKVPRKHGPASGDEGRAMADAAALAAGYALDNGDHVLIPLTAGQVARVEAP